MSDPLDVLTLVEARRALNKADTDTEADDVVARHVTAISRLIDRTCGPVVQREVTAEIHDGNGYRVLLRQWPVAAIDLVRTSGGSAPETIEAATFGVSDPGYQAVQLADDPSLLSGEVVYGWPCGKGTVEVTYTAGRYEDTEAVDARFKDCAGAILRRLWKRETGAWGQSSSLFEDADGTAGTGFFRVAAPLIDEMLWGDRQYTGAR